MYLLSVELAWLWLLCHKALEETTHFIQQLHLEIVVALATAAAANCAPHNSSDV